MSQPIVINIGAIPNDGTGDPLRTAFNDVNLNFANVFAAGLVGSNVQIANNTILTTNTNGNLVLAPNGIGVVQSNVSIVPNTANIRNLGSATQRWATVYTQYVNSTQINLSGDLSVGGNLIVTGNIVEMGNIVTDSLTIQLANTAATASSASGAGITVGANDNIATLLYNSTGNTWTTNIGLSSVGNITAPYFIGNGSQLSGMYGNVDVENYLPTSTVIIDINSNLANTNSNVANLVTITTNTDSNVANLVTITTNTDSNVANLSNNLANTNSNVANLVTITTNTDSNVANLVTITTNTDSNVANLVTITTNTDSNVANLSNDLSNTNSNVANLVTITTNTDSNVANVSNDLANTNSNVANVSNDLANTNSNVANNASNITTLQGQVYANSNVATFLADFGSNPLSTTGNVTAGYFIGDGSQLTGLPAGYTDSNVTTLLSSLGSNTINSTANVTTTANISGNYILGNAAFMTGIPASYGNSNVATLLAGFGSNTVSTTGNVTVGNIITGGGGTRGLYLGNVNARIMAIGSNSYATFGQNITLSPDTALSALAGIQIGGNGYLLAPNGARVLTLGTDGSVTVNANINQTLAGYQISTAGNIVAAGFASAVGNVKAGNVTTVGQVSATGNITTAGNFIGNGAALTNVTVSVAGNIVGTQSNVTLVAGSYNWTFNNTGNLVLPGNTFAVNYANGTAVSLGGAGSYGDSNVVTLLSAFGSNTVSTTGNITSGNLLTAGVVSATGFVKGVELTSTNSTGSEGGQINLAIPAANTTLGGTTVTVDVYQNQLRFFEGSANAKGAYIDLTTCGNSVGTNLVNRASIIAAANTAVTLDNLQARVGGSPTRLYINTVSGNLTGTGDSQTMTSGSMAVSSWVNVPIGQGGANAFAMSGALTSNGDTAILSLIDQGSGTGMWRITGMIANTTANLYGVTIERLF